VVQIAVLTVENGLGMQALLLRALQNHPEAFGVSYEEQSALTPETFAEMILSESPNRYFLGAFVDEVLVGFVGVFLDWRKKLKHNATLGTMYVAPEARGQGIGKALVDEVIVRCRTAGVEQIKLDLTAGNTAARRLYESCGFEEYGVEHRALRVGDVYYDLELMWRRI
jgi:ribosomal protein S18 acetylase RimI-like enzyme